MLKRVMAHMIGVPNLDMLDLEGRTVL
jgi:hypothetical protein